MGIDYLRKRGIPTIRGVSDLYVNSPCNFSLYFTHTLVYCGLADVSSL